MTYNLEFIAIYKQKHAHTFSILLGLNLAAFISILIFGIWVKWYETLSFFIPVVICLILNTLHCLFVLKNKAYDRALWAYTIGGAALALFLEFYATNAFILIPFIHAIALIPKLLFLEEKFIPKYLAVILLVHSIINISFRVNLITFDRLHIPIASLLFIFVCLGINVIVTSFISLRYVIQSSHNAYLNREQVLKFNKELLAQIDLRRKAEENLLAERVLLKQKVAERTAEFEQASTRKDEFLAMMSHELRTPLNTILSRTQALNLGVYGLMTQKHLSVVSGIASSGKHLLELINDVLDVSKISAGEFDIYYEVFDVEKFCDNLKNQISPIASEKKLDVGLKVSLDNLETITADKRRLKQIILNLLSNAIKFTPNNNRIGMTVTNSIAEKTITFEVWDEGIGIPKDRIKDIFQPFTQIDSELARKATGTGLGLTLVHQLTELQHGTVDIQSVPDIGTTFIITIPISPPLENKAIFNKAEQKIASFI